MADPAITSYIQQQRAASLGDQAIREALLASGWPAESVDAAFAELDQSTAGSSDLVVPENQESYAQDAPPVASEPNPDAVPRWLRTVSGGLIKTPAVANTVLILISLICLGAAIAIPLAHRAPAPSSTVDPNTPATPQTGAL